MKNPEGTERMADSESEASLRCHHCAGPLSKDMETSKWNVTPLIRDSFSMVLALVLSILALFTLVFMFYVTCVRICAFNGSRVGAGLACVHGFCFGVFLHVQIGSAVGGTTSAFYGFNHGTHFF